jgi:membrane protease YdiL (CAAX protease family)
MIVFTLLAFASSWLLWGAALLIQGGGNFSHAARLPALGGIVYLLGVFAPAFIALGLTWAREGAAARQNLLRRAFAWSIDVRWYALAILYFPLVSLAAATVRRMALGAWPAFTGERLGVILVAAVISTPAQAGEELGWRGFLLPRLSAKFGLPVASLILGLIWASWHLPFFYMAGTDKSNQSFPAYATAIVALSVAMAFLYWRTRGSVFLAMLMHSAVNNLRPVPTTAVVGHPFGMRASFMTWATSAVMWAAAAVFLVAMRGQTLNAQQVSPHNADPVLQS